ncbi:serine/threonine-protein kinase GIN4 [Amniculicola lignicola CBS 123094]|uniref:non-specific serine/threonine protein kinase n=1 Tax=Amniculicola lignicola CBS 123094 TaxID=1392246 RepID=A0A6A5WYT3_9PLEO|nr:serine/threonine-protein kinase GIN4 [Amniculicola lignicola CBS 123094]
MDHVYHGRPPTRRQVLGDASHRANSDTSSQLYPGEKLSLGPCSSPGQHLPHNEALVPDGTSAVRQPPQPSPENKRLSAVINDSARPHNPKRDSEISNASTNASGTGRRRKTHIGPWQLGKTIGRGGCSRVRVVRHSGTGELGAAKIISKKMAEKVRALSLANLIETAQHDPSLFPGGGKFIPFGLEREIVIMKLLDHPHIVRLHDVWENSNELYLIMEYVEGGELFSYIGEHERLEEIEVVHLFRQIIAALLYCHRLSIHHRDLKPENILLDKVNMHIKLVDFGMAALQPAGKKLTTPCGSPHYAAPEVIRTEKYDGGKADIWSCGVILFVMLTGTPPFNYAAGRDERENLKYLFRAIERASYVMPDDLSREAKDLIKKILVRDPKRRISIEEIWKHPFLHKYDVQLNFYGEAATLQHWVGPVPTITEWLPLERDTIDREILRYLRTLWHSEEEEVLVQRLLSEEPNQEKYFYNALQKYHNEQLENWSPSPYAVAYSNSDHHHHVRPISKPQPSISKKPKHAQSQSGYSILNDEHLQSKHSFYEAPPSDVSYDPFRASREPVMPGSSVSISRNVTVYRGSDGGSRKLRPATALGHRTGSSLRIQALRNSKRSCSGGVSRESSKRSNPSQRSQYSTTAHRRSISRSSLVSSQYPSSPPVYMHRSSMVKRGVSFSHLRRSSVPSTYVEAGCIPEQLLKHTLSRSTAVSSIISPRPSISAHSTPPVRTVAKMAMSPKVPRLRIRKPDSPSKYIQSEVRKVSTELEKVMEEAFNRSSISSSVRTGITDANRDTTEYDTPPTSFSNRDYGASTIATPHKLTLQNRPLPPIPDETPNTFLLRKLAETREEIARRLGDNGDNTEHFNEVLENLDRLMKPSIAKRTSSAPTKSPEHPTLLPVIVEEVKPGEDRYEPYSANYRAVTDPIRPNLHGPRAVTEQHTIRLVDHSPTPIAPLNIRKRSGASAKSYTAAADESRTVPWLGPVRPYQGIQNDLLAARANLAAPSSTVQPTVPEKEATIKKKKSSWFRRTPEEKERPQENVPKPAIGRLQIPESWQGLDDRIKNNHLATTSAGAVGHDVMKHNPSASGVSTSSEFPMRNRVNPVVKNDNSNNITRKGFLGLFGKKMKENKGKRMMDLGSANFSSSSILSGFDLCPEADDGSPARPFEIQTNWLSRFLHIKPASKIVCFCVGRGKVRQDLVRLLRDWERFGVQDVTFDRKTNVINARVDKTNHLKIKPVSIVIELFVILEHGRRASLCLARFTQTRGAASSFRKVVDIITDVCQARGMLVEDEEKKSAMCEVLE